jgi:hypothetical protein
VLCTLAPPRWVLKCITRSSEKTGGENSEKTMSRPSTLTIASLKQMLNIRRAELSRLQKQRAKIAKELNALDRAIARIGGTAGGRGRGGSRARNAQSLVEALTTALKDAGKPLSVGDIMAAVEAGGYQSTSDNFRGIINQTLIKERRRFSAASRGVYQLKK